MHTSLNLLSTSVSEKLADYDDTLPRIYTKQQTTDPGVVSSTSFANLAGTSLTIDLPRKAQVEVSLNAWLNISAFERGSVSMRVGVGVSGANSIPPNEGIPDFSSGWGGVLYLATGAGGGTHQKSSVRLLEMNPGISTFTIQGMRSVTTVPMSVRYSYYIVKVLRWLD